MFNPLTIGFFILGLIGVLASVPALIRSYSSKSWPCVKGAVIESCLDISDTRQSRSSSDQSGPGSQITVYPHLVFEYSVNNKKYKSKKIAVLRGWTETEARKYPDRYPVGSEVDVYYKPSNPNIGVIEPGVHMTAFLGLYISAIFMFMGGYWMFS